MRAASLMGAVAGKWFPAVFPVAMKEAVPVMEEDSVAEGVAEGKPCNTSGDPCRLLAISWYGDHLEITKIVRDGGKAHE
jgi:hypothetical protein